MILESVGVIVFPFDDLAGRELHFGSQQHRVGINGTETIEDSVPSLFFDRLMNALFKVCYKQRHPLINFWVQDDPHLFAINNTRKYFFVS